MYKKVLGDDPQAIEEAWPSSVLPLVRLESIVLIDTGVPSDSPCPVRVHWFDEPPQPPDVLSLGELVMVWIEAIERGVWRYDRVAEHWTLNHEVLATWWAGKRGVA